jgi:hypothetical protein
MIIQTVLKMYDHADRLIATIRLSSPTEATIEKIMNLTPDVVYSKLETIYIK